MTPNKLPPLPERKPGVDRLWDTQWMNIVNHADCWRTFTKEDAVAQAVLMTEQKMAENFRAAEALRQSQSLPAGAVAGLVGKWREEAEKLRKCGGRAQRRGDLADADVSFTAAQDACAYADELEQALQAVDLEECHRHSCKRKAALQADAREKGEAVAAIDSLVADMYEHAARFQRENTEVSAVRGSMLCFADLIKMHVDRLATQPAHASPADQLAAQAQELNMGYETRPAQTPQTLLVDCDADEPSDAMMAKIASVVDQDLTCDRADEVAALLVSTQHSTRPQPAQASEKDNG